MILVNLKSVYRKPALIHCVVCGTILCASFALTFGVGLSSLGRDSTLTGRTDIWNLVLGMVSNPLLGTGFESFWLGERLEAIRKLYPNHVNQSHNGYIEIYINLGWVGVCLLMAFLVSGYRTTISAVRRREEAGDIKLALFMVAVIYNFTEASFKMTGFAWLSLLLAAVAVPPEAVKSTETEQLATPEQSRYHWADLYHAGLPKLGERAS
jgi:exopolysaccharide production protein ExoQ